MIFLRPIYISLIIIRSPDRDLDYFPEGNITELRRKNYNESWILVACDVLLGHSGYGTLFPFYESLRENIKKRWWKL
jgi:hypothetical protein